jgi:hypothetical protein
MIHTRTHMIRRMMLAGVFLAVAVGTSQAGVIIDINQVGSDVVETGSGTIDLTGLTGPSTYDTFYAAIQPNVALAHLAPAQHGGINMDEYSSATGPTSFGSGTSHTFATTGSGDAFGVETAHIILSPGYVSGTPLSATDTFASQTLKSLGLTPGTYTYTWSSDFLTVNIGTSSVPEPSAAILSGIGAMSVAAFVLVRKRRAQRRGARHPKHGEVGVPECRN